MVNRHRSLVLRKPAFDEPSPPFQPVRELFKTRDRLSNGGAAALGGCGKLSEQESREVRKREGVGDQGDSRGTRIAVRGHPRMSVSKPASLRLSYKHAGRIERSSGSYVSAYLLAAWLELFSALFIGKGSLKTGALTPMKLGRVPYPDDSHVWDHPHRQSDTRHEGNRCAQIVRHYQAMRIGLRTNSCGWSPALKSTILGPFGDLLLSCPSFAFCLPFADRPLIPFPMPHSGFAARPEQWWP